MQGQWLIHTNEVSPNPDTVNTTSDINYSFLSTNSTETELTFNYDENNSSLQYSYDVKDLLLERNEGSRKEANKEATSSSTLINSLIENDIQMHLNSNSLTNENAELSDGNKEESNEVYFSSRINSDSFRYHNDGIICRLYGGMLSLLNLASVWIVVGLHCDKYCAIASPLRYNQIVTRKRIAIYSLIVWVTSFGLATFVTVLAPDFDYVGGVCLPVWYKTGEIVYTVCLALVLIVFPSVLFTLANGKILLIARQHQHRIFSAIFEVMMSAQATVTQQRNPFDMPKMKQKSAWAICEQMLGFALCYCPLLLYLFLECILLYPISEIFAVVMVGTLLLAPLINSFVYGIKSATVKKIFKNYLRKKISRSVMKCEIEARIPSAQNSRRPSISSTLGFPAIQKSLQRRMSDYLSPENLPELDTKEIRRSSDLSWHPLDEGTPTSSRLREPLDIDLSNTDWPSPGDTSVSHYLAVPTFEASRTYNNITPSQHRSQSSIDSEETLSTKEPATEEELLGTSAERSPSFRNKSDDIKEEEPRNHRMSYSLSVGGDELSIPNGKCNNILSVNMPYYRRKSSAISSITSEETQIITSSTPLLCRAYMSPWPKIEPSNMNSPYIIRTLESLMSVGLSQSRLLKSSSLWRGNSKEIVVNGPKVDSLYSGSSDLDINLEMKNNLHCVDLMLGDTLMSIHGDETENGIKESSIVAT